MDNISKNYLPEFLRDIDVKITSANLKTIKATDGRYRQTYSISWTGQHKTEMITAQSTTHDGFWGFLKRFWPTNASSDDHMARCDGPCNMEKPLDEMKLIGLCEHVVCQQCLQAQQKVSIKDGGSGCPNEECYTEDLEVLKRRESPTMKANRYSGSKPTSRVMRDQEQLCSKNCVKAHPRSLDICREIECPNRDQARAVPKVFQQTLQKSFKNVMLDRDEESRVASNTSTDYEHVAPSVSHCLVSEVLEGPLRADYRKMIESTILKKVHILIIQGGYRRWIEDDIPGNFDLLEALKTILKNHEIKASKTGYNFLAQMPSENSKQNEWSQLTHMDMTLPLKRITESEELYLVLEIPIVRQE